MVGVKHCVRQLTDWIPGAGHPRFLLSPFSPKTNQIITSHQIDSPTVRAAAGGLTDRTGN